MNDRTFHPGLTFLSMDDSTRQHCELLVTELADLGQRLWVQGYIIGTDRKNGLSPGDYGDDAVVGLGLVCQIAGELGRGCLRLLDDDNRYGAAALSRQLLEVEYLAWWFETSAPEAAQWLRSTEA